MRKQNKPRIAPKPSDSDLRAIEHTESELLALQNDEAEDEALTDETLADAVAPIASTSIDLAHLGMDRLAYVRRAVIDDMPMWSIHSASGFAIGAAPTLEKAWGAIVQNDLQPVFVH